MRRASAALLLGAGALCLTVKASVILAWGAFLYEDGAISAGLLFAAVGTIPLARLAGPSRMRTAALALAALAVVAGGANFVAGALAAPETARGPLYAGSTLGLVAALVLAGLAGRSSRAPWARRAFWAGALFVPATLIGGALSVLDERLLEIGLLAVAALLAWVAAGVRGEAEASAVR